MYTKEWMPWYKSFLAQLVRRWTIDREMRCQVSVQVQIGFTFFIQNFCFSIVNFLLTS